MRCKTCQYWSDNHPDAGRYPPAHEVNGITFCKCYSPKVQYGYGRADAALLGESGIMVEDDEGWGMLTGPEFGCVHHSDLEPAMDGCQISYEDLQALLSWRRRVLEFIRSLPRWKTAKSFEGDIVLYFPGAREFSQRFSVYLQTRIVNKGHKDKTRGRSCSWGGFTLGDVVRRAEESLEEWKAMERGEVFVGSSDFDKAPPYWDDGENNKRQHDDYIVTKHEPVSVLKVPDPVPPKED